MSKFSNLFLRHQEHFDLQMEAEEADAAQSGPARTPGYITIKESPVHPPTLVAALQLVAAKVKNGLLPQ